MAGFKLKKYCVDEAHFSIKGDMEKQANIEGGVEGGIRIPKDSTENRNVVVQLYFHFGGEDAGIEFNLKTIYFFEADESLGTDITEEMVKRECIPVALTQLRKMVKTVSEAYGRGSIDLPPFDEENNE